MWFYQRVQEKPSFYYNSGMSLILELILGKKDTRLEIFWLSWVDDGEIAQVWDSVAYQANLEYT